MVFLTMQKVNKILLKPCPVITSDTNYYEFDILKYLFLEVVVVLPAAVAHDRAQVEVGEAPELQRGHRVVGQLLVLAAALQRLTVVVDRVGAGV